MAGAVRPGFHREGATWPGRGEAGARTPISWPAPCGVGSAPSPQPSPQGQPGLAAGGGSPAPAGPGRRRGAESSAGSEKGPGRQGRAAMGLWRAEPGEASAGPAAGGSGARAPRLTRTRAERTVRGDCPSGCNRDASARSPSSTGHTQVLQAGGAGDRGDGAAGAWRQDPAGLGGRERGEEPVAAGGWVPGRVMRILGFLQQGFGFPRLLCDFVGVSERVEPEPWGSPACSSEPG